jgi:hypothetical protein
VRAERSLPRELLRVGRRGQRRASFGASGSGATAVLILGCRLRTTSGTAALVRAAARTRRRRHRAAARPSPPLPPTGPARPASGPGPAGARRGAHATVVPGRPGRGNGRAGRYRPVRASKACGPLVVAFARRRRRGRRRSRTRCGERSTRSAWARSAAGGRRYGGVCGQRQEPCTVRQTDGSDAGPFPGPRPAPAFMRCRSSARALLVVRHRASGSSVTVDGRADLCLRLGPSRRKDRRHESREST